MCGTFEPLPSPLMGEGAGGGEDHTSSPHPNLPPLRGEGVFTPLVSPLMGKGRYEWQFARGVILLSEAI